MRLDFNILWVEDQQHLIKSQKERIERSLKKEGFRLQTQFAPSVAKAVEFLSDEIYGDHIDLVLMDYDLGAGGRGDDGIVEVRRIFQYKDIIFYSSQAPDLLDLVAKKQVQGVFCSTRESLFDTVDGVFDALVKKVLDIDHCRGIVMGATSDIDHEIMNCLELTFKLGSDAERAGALNIIQKHLLEKEKSFVRDLKKISEIDDVANILDHHHIYTSNDRLRLLRSILQDAKFDQAELDAMREYLDSTVPRRNDLAHLRVRRQGFSRKLYDRYEREFTMEEMRSLRQQLLDYQTRVEELPNKVRQSKK